MAQVEMRFLVKMHWAHLFIRAAGLATRLGWTPSPKDGQRLLDVARRLVVVGTEDGKGRFRRLPKPARHLWIP